MAIKKQLAKLAKMTGMKIVEEEETEGSPPKEESELATSASEETPPPAGMPVDASEARGEEEVVLLGKKGRSKKGGCERLGYPLWSTSPLPLRPMVRRSTTTLFFLHYLAS
jgi:hypothetical protein